MRRTLIVGLAVVALLTGACSSDTAVTEAKAACHIAPPTLPSQSTSKHRARQEASSYESAQQHAERAEAADGRWKSLNEADATLAAIWAYVASYGWTAQAASPQTEADAGQAAQAIRSECAVADASS